MTAITEILNKLADLSILAIAPQTHNCAPQPTPESGDIADLGRFLSC